MIALADEKHKPKKPHSPKGHKKQHSPPKEPANLYPSFDGWGGVPGGQGFQPSPPPPPQQPLFDAGRTYYIYCASKTTKCLQVNEQGQHANKLAVHDWNQSINQRFKIAAQGQPGQYLIRCVAGNRFVDLVDKSNTYGDIIGSSQFDGSTTLWTI